MKYQEVIDYLMKSIENEEFSQGERLPSIRELVLHFGFNKSTIIRAYKELEQNHIIYSIPQSGYYLVDQGKDKNLSVDEKIDFISTVPDNKFLPYQEFSHCMNRAIELYRHDLFTYGNVAGLEVLRNTLEGFFWDQQISVSKEDIFITAGTQQALSIISDIEFPTEREGVLVEEPGYSAMIRLLELNKSDIYTVKRDFDGLDFEKLEEIFASKKIKFFYIIPRFHNPLGTSLSEKDKQKLVRLAHKYKVYLVEDDYLSDLAGTNRSLPLYYYDTNNMVIYIKSFSKSFMPGIRIGAVLIPKALQESFIDHKKHRDLNTSILAQGGLNIYISSGMYQNHLKKTVAEYQRKMNYARSIIKSANEKIVKTVVPQTGIFIYLRLPDNFNLLLLVNRMKKNNIIIEDSSRFFYNGKENGIRLCLSELSKEKIIKGLRLLIDEIHNIATHM
jgi:DNA-binding transcriptional MocR family regulator